MVTRSNGSRLLLVSPDDSLTEVARGIVRSIGGIGLEVVLTVDEARSHLEVGAVALVLLHLAAGDDGAGADRLLRAIVAANQPVPTLVVSDEHRPDQALILLRSGVADYLSRPLDRGRLAYLIEILTVRARLAGPRPGPESEQYPIRRLGGEDPFFYLPDSKMGRLMEQIRRVAPRDATVLLGGETGTGKTHLARLIHELSARRNEPFLAINCGALSATLIESEMFGHVRGAFTGADKDRTGKFTEAGSGTLFLDEVDALPPSLQAKLLRAVEERVFEPVGSNATQPMRARLIAASNRALEQEVAAGRFRADLYYRLNVISFELPPLRERGGVIPYLVDNFIAQFAARSERRVVGASPEALRALEAYAWPGNIRELRNVIERAVALSVGEEIRPEDLPDHIRLGPNEPRPAPPSLGVTPRVASTPTLTQAVDDAEKNRITVALERHNNNRLRAAAELGISRMTLYKKLHKYGLMAVI